MRTLLPGVVALLACMLPASAQEKKPSADTIRISIPGCVKDRRFIVAEPLEGEPVRTTMRVGRRFRLDGDKKLLNEIKARAGTMVEVTALIRQADYEERGMAVAGGRVRIGGAAPQAPFSGGRDPGYGEVLIDVEGYRVLPASCPRD